MKIKFIKWINHKNQVIKITKLTVKIFYKIILKSIRIKIYKILIEIKFFKMFYKIKNINNRF